MRFAPRVSLAATGVVLAGMVVSMEIWGGFRLPHGYGFCTTCHAQDLVAWFANQLANTHWQLSPAGSRTPIVTGVGILIGSYIAARLAGERRRTAARHPWLSLLAGIAAANLGLLALGCPIRQVVLLGYGDWLAVAAVLPFGLGGVLALMYTKWRVGRSS
jgi:hypothetical protein